MIVCIYVYYTYVYIVNELFIIFKNNKDNTDKN